MDYGGWFEHQDRKFIKLEDLYFIAAMTPTSGSNTVTPRYIRWFNTIYLQPFEAHSMQRIYDYILQWYF